MSVDCVRKESRGSRPVDVEKRKMDSLGLGQVRSQPCRLFGVWFLQSIHYRIQGRDEDGL